MLAEYIYNCYYLYRTHNKHPEGIFEEDGEGFGLE